MNDMKVLLKDSMKQKYVYSYIYSLYEAWLQNWNYCIHREFPFDHHDCVFTIYFEVQFNLNLKTIQIYFLCLQFILIHSMRHETEMH